MTTTEPEWIFSPEWRQALFLALGLVWLLVWYHRQRVAFEDKQPDNPTMSFPALIRYVGHKSLWAARRQKEKDGDWIKDIFSEIRRALVMEELSGYGICERRPDGSRDLGPSKIPVSFWQNADFDPDAAYRISHEDIAEQTKLNFAVYSSVRFDPEKVKRVWPRRGPLSAGLRRSPAERTGIVEIWSNDRA